MSTALEKDTAAADQVEILDGGVHVGRAPLINGRWTCPDLTLAQGDHSFTAKYGGMVTSAWNVRVATVDFDDFESAVVGKYTVLEREFFVVRLTATGQTGGRTAMAIDDYRGSKELVGEAINQSGYNFRSQMDITFRRPCSKVFFNSRCQSYGGGTNRVDALSAGSEILASFDFYPFGSERPVVPVTLEAVGGVNIASLRFTLVPGQSPSWPAVWIDDVAMTY